MATLSDKIAFAAKPRETQYKLGDGETPGLFLLVKPNGGKVWRYREVAGGADRQRTLGHFPDMKLAAARTLAGSNRVGEAGVLFEVAAHDWLEFNEPKWSDVTHRVIKGRLERHVFPVIGRKALLAIGTPDVMKLVEACRAAKKYETAKRILQYMDQVFALANARHGYEHNPAAQVARMRLPRPAVDHHKAPTPEQLGALLLRLESYRSRTTGRLFEFLILTAARKAEAQGLDWSELSSLGNPETALWTLPAERAKMRRPHTVPLSPRALALLKEQADGKWPTSGLVFPHPSGAPLSENALLEVLYKAGWKGLFDVHGLRSAFATWGADTGQPRDVVDACLSHRVGGAVSAIYNRSQYEGAKRVVLNAWSEHLAELLGKAREQKRMDDLL